MGRKRIEPLLSPEQSSGSTVNASSINKEATMPDTQTETAAPTVETITKTYSYFSLETMSDVSEDVTITFEPVTDYQSGLARLGNDVSEVVTAITKYLREKALDAAAKTVKEKGVPKKVLLDACKSFRLMYPWSAMVTKEKGQEGWKDQYNAQTNSIVEFIKSNEVLLNGLRRAASEATFDESDSSDNT